MKRILQVVCEEMTKNITKDEILTKLILGTAFTIITASTSFDLGVSLGRFIYCVFH